MNREKKKKKKWREKRTYGQFVREIKEDINESKSWSWVKNSDIKASTTTLIFSAQEQALSTSYTKFHIDKPLTHERRIDTIKFFVCHKYT